MITILTPAYNRGYVIHKAYKSLLQQKNKDFEWVVIDDGSTDNTKEVIEKFIDENKINISYYRKLLEFQHIFEKSLKSASFLESSVMICGFGQTDNKKGAAYEICD